MINILIFVGEKYVSFNLMPFPPHSLNETLKYASKQHNNSSRV